MVCPWWAQGLDRCLPELGQEASSDSRVMDRRQEVSVTEYMDSTGTDGIRNRNQEDGDYEDRNQGDWSQGDRSQGDRNQGDRSQGEMRLIESRQGDTFQKA